MIANRRKTCNIGRGIVEARSLDIVGKDVGDPVEVGVDLVVDQGA